MTGVEGDKELTVWMASAGCYPFHILPTLPQHLHPNPFTFFQYIDREKYVEEDNKIQQPEQMLPVNEQYIVEIFAKRKTL